MVDELLSKIIESLSTAPIAPKNSAQKDEGFLCPELAETELGSIAVHPVSHGDT